MILIRITIVSLLLFTGISAQALQTVEMAELNRYMELFTLQNGLIACAAGLGTYGLYKLFHELQLKIKEFVQLIEIEREKQKKRVKRREKQYKVARLIGNPAVSLLDKFYEKKAVLGKKFALKMLARTIAVWLP